MDSPFLLGPVITDVFTATIYLLLLIKGNLILACYRKQHRPKELINSGIV